MTPPTSWKQMYVVLIVQMKSKHSRNVTKNYVHLFNDCDWQIVAVMNRHRIHVLTIWAVHLTTDPNHRWWGESGCLSHELNSVHSHLLFYFFFFIRNLLEIVLLIIWDKQQNMRWAVVRVFSFQCGCIKFQ
jgi:hypothetical protein